jgi:hypothetical protein
MANSGHHSEILRANLLRGRLPKFDIAQLAQSSVKLPSTKLQLLLGYKEKPSDLDAVSIYQRDRWGTLSGETASLNLSALHATSFNTPVNRIAHREERISTFRDRLEENKPKFVVFYGTGYSTEYEKIVGTQFNGAGYAWHLSTLCLLVRHPTGQSNPAEMKQGGWWIRKGQEIRSLINTQAEDSLPITGESFQEESHRAQTPLPRLPTIASDHQAPETHVAPTKRISDPRLAELESKWRYLRIGPQFHQAHHFASNKFSGKRASLDRFVAWCDGREIRAENDQTLTRALDVACRVKEGEDFNKALEQAWTAHPIVTR